MIDMVHIGPMMLMKDVLQYYFEGVALEYEVVDYLEARGWGKGAMQAAWQLTYEELGTVLPDLDEALKVFYHIFL